MKFYLSSYKLGQHPERLKDLMMSTAIGYIPNAVDFSTATPKRVKQHIKNDINSLNQLGLKTEIIDLKVFFNRQKRLYKLIKSLAGIWVSGGNVFVLRHAMKLSGLDNILTKCTLDPKFVYAGYSAGCCVLSPNLAPYQIVDDANDFPYEKQKTTIWEGLGLLDFAFMPHHDSDHPESKEIDKEISICQAKNIPYKAFTDGEVFIFDT